MPCLPAGNPEGLWFGRLRKGEEGVNSGDGELPSSQSPLDIFQFLPWCKISQKPALQPEVGCLCFAVQNTAGQNQGAGSEHNGSSKEERGARLYRSRCLQAAAKAVSLLPKEEAKVSLAASEVQGALVWYAVHAVVQQACKGPCSCI